jgi:cytochrome P450
MTRDEQMYPKAELFNPERFMNQNGGEADQTDPKDFIFGFGRRQVVLISPFRPYEPHAL